MNNIEQAIKTLQDAISSSELERGVEIMNQAREALHEVSPFKTEPVDLVLWVKNTSVHANDYNPNSVAPPEMKLLEHSIACDGYTQPIVTAYDRQLGKMDTGDTREVIDGFHRNRVGKESELIQDRVKGYLPVVTIKDDRTGINDRMASTVRHNRARGKHGVDSMSDMVVALKRRKWSDKKIAKELGMEPDEVLRLSQVSGLAVAFASRDFSEAWEVVQDSGEKEEID